MHICSIPKNDFIYIPVSNDWASLVYSRIFDAMLLSWYNPSMIALTRLIIIISWPPYCPQWKREQVSCALSWLSCYLAFLQWLNNDKKDGAVELCKTTWHSSNTSMSSHHRLWSSLKGLVECVLKRWHQMSTIVVIITFWRRLLLLLLRGWWLHLYKITIEITITLF